MSDFDRNARDPVNNMDAPVNQNGLRRGGFSSGSVVGAAVVVVLILIAVGYVFAGRSTTGPAVTHEPAAATAPAPAATPAAPVPAATPQASPGPPATSPKP